LADAYIYVLQIFFSHFVFCLSVYCLIYRIPQFIYESKSERIIEIGPHLPKLS